MSSGKYLFDFTGGCQSVVLENLLLGNVDTAGIKLYGVFNTGASTTSNGNLVFINVVVNQFSGRAYNFGGGDSVWFYGGRIIGTHDQTTDWKTNGAQGIYLNGGLGGLWIYGTDVVLCKYGMIINDENDSSNKEIFLNSPCFDSCSAIGLSIQDTSSYVSISNIWSASCETACLHTESDYAGLLSITGGAIYNAGARGLNTSTSLPPCGCVFNGGGNIQLSSVIIRENGNSVTTGKGIWCPSSSGVKSLKLIGCQSYDNNDSDLLGASTHVMIEDCYFDKSPNMISLSDSPGIHHVRNNVGYPASITTPSILTSGTALAYLTSASPAMVYLNGGTVTGVAVNGTTIFTSSGVSFMLSPGDTVTLTYSSAPTWAFLSVH